MAALRARAEDVSSREVVPQPMGSPERGVDSSANDGQSAVGEHRSPRAIPSLCEDGLDQIGKGGEGACTVLRCPRRVIERWAKRRAERRVGPQLASRGTFVGVVI